MNSFTSDVLKMYLEQGLVSIGMLFVVASIILFIVDISKAKKENRKVKLWIKIMFIISLILIALLIIGVVLLVAALVWYMMNG